MLWDKRNQNAHIYLRLELNTPCLSLYTRLLCFVLNGNLSQHANRQVLKLFKSTVLHSPKHCDAFWFATHLSSSSCWWNQLFLFFFRSFDHKFIEKSQCFRILVTNHRHLPSVVAIEMHFFSNAKHAFPWIIYEIQH